MRRPQRPKNPAPGLLDDAREYLPAQWSNRQIDECVANLLTSHPKASAQDRKMLDTMAAERKRRIA